MLLVSTLIAGASILMIGDSHLSKPTYLIKTLHDELVHEGASVHTVSACGSVPGDWLGTAKMVCGAERVGNGPITAFGQGATTHPVKALIAGDKAKLVIVVMGDTMAGYKKEFAKAWAWQQVTSLTREIASTGAACVWVGPPWGSEGGQYGKTFARVQVVSNFLAANVAPCLYVDSTKLSKQGGWATADGQHLDTTGYQAWGSAISKVINAMPAANRP